MGKQQSTISRVEECHFFSPSDSTFPSPLSAATHQSFDMLSVRIQIYLGHLSHQNLVHLGHRSKPDHHCLLPTIDIPPFPFRCPEIHLVILPPFQHYLQCWQMVSSSSWTCVLATTSQMPETGLTDQGEALMP
jgi:hypothetical protein